MSFMADPMRVFRTYLRSQDMSPHRFEIGALAVGLEIVARIRLLEELPVTSEVGRQEAISVLQTILTDLELSDMAYDWYDRLAEWRKPKFEATAYERFELALSRSVPAADGSGLLSPGPPDGSSSGTSAHS